MRYRVDPHSPVNIWLEVDGHDDDQVAMARTPHKATQLVDAANGNLAKLELLAGYFMTVQEACGTGDENHVLDVIVEATETLAADLEAAEMGRGE